MRMKRILVNFLLLIVVLVVSQAQDISRYEYWLDDNHSERYLVDSSDKDIAFNISTVSLSEGVHSLNFRAYRSDGVWGDFNRYLFYIASSSRSVGEITEYEYWIDNATNKVIGTDIKSDYDFNVDVSNLTNGKHVFCFRVKDTSGEWSNIYFEEFEIKNGVQPILPSLTISSIGNGATTYNGSSVRNQSSSFTIEEGSNAIISFVPDNGYRIKSVKVNNTDVTSSVSNSSYTVSNIKANTTVEVEFEAIPINSYTLKYVVDGVTYQTYQIQEGATITPEAMPTKEGYTFSGWSEIPQTMPSMDVTVTGSFIVNKYKLTYQVDGVEYKSYDVEYGAKITPETFPTKDGYTFSGWSEIPKTMPAKDVTVVGTFTKDEPVIYTYTLTITASGNGSATFNNTTAKNDLKTFTLNEGTSATIAFTPDSGYRIKSVKVNSVDVTSSVSNNSYTVGNIKDNTIVNVEFEAIPTTDTTLISGDKFEVDGITYVVNNDVNTVSVTSGNAKYSGDVAIPSSVVYLGNTYSVNSIGDNAFRDCHDLTSIIIPNSVKYIGERAFVGCGLTSITIPESVVRIDFKALCCNIHSITILGSPNFGREAFNGCDALTAVNISNLESFLKIGYDDMYLMDNTPLNYAHHLYLNGEEIKDLIIPNTITSINDMALSGGSSLTSVTIPSSVTSIGVRAFWNCSSLTAVTIPISVSTIREHAFEGCSSLSSIISEIDNPYAISNSVFEGIPSDAQLIVPKGTKAVYQATEGWNRFTNIVEAGSIEDVFEVNGIYYKIGENSIVAVTKGNTNYYGDIVIPSQVIYEGKTYNVTSIDSYAFEDCSLTSVTIPNSVISIGNGAFYRCSLKSITIPGSVTSIGDQAFYDCVVLTSVTIPNSVTSIGDKAFGMCNSLTTIVSEIAKPFVINTSVFDFYDQNYRTLIVPKGTKSAYQATEGWNQFTNIVEAGEAEPVQPGQIHINDIFYKVTGSGEAEVVSVDNGVTSITIPSTVLYNKTSYKVTAIAKDAFENCDHLSAVIWEPDAQFNAKVNNPNFLLYVSDEKYASRSVKNVVVNGVAESIELTDAANGNDFYCPRAFSARNIVYSHNYQMETGIGDSRGWETIVLPFDVQKYTHATKGELESFTTWTQGSNKKPFWLFELTISGYKDVAGIKANTPYIISMPNNQQYEQQYQIPGVVTFSASDVEVKKSDNLIPANYQGKTFVPNYTNQNKLDFLALNVSNNYVTNPSKDIAGSRFIRGLRAVHPFEAYMTTTDNTRSIDVMEGMTTSIRGIQIVKDEASTIKVYDTRGVLMKTATNKDDVRNGLKAGVYIVNGKKMVIK